MDREIDDNLREYYRRFLQDVRGLKQSTVKHYDEALKKISQILIAKIVYTRFVHWIDF